MTALTLALGFGLSQLGEFVRERRERHRIVLTRAADVEGEALIELQDRLLTLQQLWVGDLYDMAERASETGGADPEDAYKAAQDAGKPWHRALVLASRIIDDSVREKVENAIRLAYPYENHRKVQGFFVDGPGRSFSDYPYDEAEAAVMEANNAIGDRLRQTVP